MTAADLVTYRRKEVGFVWQQTSRNVLITTGPQGPHRSDRRARRTGQRQSQCSRRRMAVAAATLPTAAPATAAPNMPTRAARRPVR